MKTLVSTLVIFASLNACTTRSPITATGVPFANLKTGKICLHTVLDVFNVAGHTDIASAAKEAGIKNISVVDQEVKNYFYVYKKTCTLVYGS